MAKARKLVKEELPAIEDHASMAADVGDGLSALVVNIDKDIAKVWLFNHNKKNRPIRRSVVKRYCGAMLNGEWSLNGESMIFDVDGTLRNGQHQLSALVAAGEENPRIKIKKLVVWGVKRNSFDTMDQGEKRSLKDVLALMGEEAAQVLAGAVRLVWILSTSKTVQSAGGLRVQVAEDILSQNEQLRESVEYMTAKSDEEAEECGYDRLFTKAYLSPAYAAGLHYLMSDQDAATGEWEEDKRFKDTTLGSWCRADQFWREVTTGFKDTEGKKGITKDDVTYRLRQWLIKNRSAEKKANRDYLVRVICKAWSLYKAGESVTSLDLTKAEREDKTLYTLVHIEDEDIPQVEEEATEEEAVAEEAAAE